MFLSVAIEPNVAALPLIGAGWLRNGPEEVSGPAKKSPQNKYACGAKRSAALRRIGICSHDRVLKG